ncbi:hypothetical protein [Dyadobacter sp. CY351]|uniref:hypothetical protein n=1 Tax=Dyadobacter sp. CY351 TaxID=2909337 RepID=UPI001F187E9C|nr:hypothetical protein [Dyadobacter sp. CY351]MCF2521106.1 hypothetical protein [Dyadobacter sp. CY351]
MASVRFEVYFDEKFIDAIDDQIDTQDENLADFLAFCKKFQGGEVDIYTDMSVDKISSKRNESFFFRSINANGGPIFQSLPELNMLLALESFYSSTTGYKLFFVEREDIDVLKDDFGYLYFNIQKIVTDWKDFSRARIQEIGTFPITTNTDCEPRLDNWSYLRHFQHPLNSILICDRYILQDKHTFRHNLFQIFEQLICKNIRELQFEIFIISELKGTAKVGDKWQNIDNDIVEYGRIIQEKLQRRFGVDRIQITLIKLVSDRENRDLFYKEHGRSFITNYWYLNPHNSFNFFKYDAVKKSVVLSVQDNMDIRFTFHKEVRNILKARLMNFQDITQSINDIPTQKRLYGFPEIIKKSRLLPMR